MAAINMVLLGNNEHARRAGPTGRPVAGIDRVIGGHDPVKDIRRRGNMWTIDTGAGFAAMNRLTLVRIDVDPLDIRTFEVNER